MSAPHSRAPHSRKRPCCCRRGHQPLPMPEEFFTTGEWRTVGRVCKNCGVMYHEFIEPAGLIERV